MNFIGQHVQIVESNSDSIDLLCVDRRGESGLNQFRCSLVPLSLGASGEFELDPSREVLKTKVIGKVFDNNPGTLVDSGCLVSAFRDNKSTKVAMIVGYPKVGVEFGLVVFDLDNAAGQSDSNQVLNELRKSVIRLDFAPTSILFAPDTRFSTSLGGVGTLFIGGGDGNIVKIRCDETDSVSLTSQTVFDQSGHRTSIRDMQLGKNANGESRIYSASRTEIISWDPQSGGLEKTLFGHNGEIIGMNVMPFEEGSKSTKLISIASQIAEGATANELRVWEPDSSKHDSKRERNTSVESPIVTGTMDKKPGSNAIAYAFRSGALEYWDPDTERTVTIPNPANDLGLSQGDWRRSEFELFDDRWLTFYSNSKGMMLWDLENAEQTAPISFVPDALQGKRSTNPQNFMSASRDGNFIATSHPTDKSRVLLWTKQRDGVYKSDDIGPFGRRTTGVEPIVSPDGQWIAVVARTKYKYSVELFRRSEIVTQNPTSLIQSPAMRGYTNFNNLVFSGDSSEFILAQDRTSSSTEKKQEKAARKIEMFRYRLDAGQWDFEDIEVPAALSTNTQQINFYDMIEDQGNQYFLGVVGLSPAGFEDRGLNKNQLGALGAHDLVIWDKNGIKARQAVKFSRRLNPTFHGENGHVVYLDSDIQGRRLTDWSWQDGNVSVINTEAASDIPPSYWVGLPGGKYVVKGKDWMTLASRVNDRLAPAFNVSLSNRAKSVELYDQTILVHHNDNSATLIDISNGGQPKIQRLKGRDQANSMSPDGKRIARLSADQKTIRAFEVQSLLGDSNAEELWKSERQNNPAAVTWQPTSGLARFGVKGGSEFKVVSLAKLDKGLLMEFLECQSGDTIGDSLLEWGNEQDRVNKREKEIRTFKMASVSGQFVVVTWDDDQTPVDIWRLGVALDETGAEQLSWAYVQNRISGQVNGVDFSEVVVGDSPVGSRIAIASSSENRTENSVRIFLVQKSKDQLYQYELTQVQNVGEFQPIDVILGASFSGDGKTLGTLTRNQATVWLTDGWDDEKAESENDADENIVFTREQIRQLKESGDLSDETAEKLDKLETKFTEEQIEALLNVNLISPAQAADLRNNNIQK